VTDPVPPARPEPCPSAFPVPLRPEEDPRAFRARHAAKGLGVALGILVAATTIGGLLGRYVVGSGAHDQWAPIVCGVMGFGAGAYVVLPVVLVVAWRRRASPGFRAGVAIVLGLSGLLATACFLEL
jgi:hypothetical protein